jgi:hypothetical protein
METANLLYQNDSAAFPIQIFLKALDEILGKPAVEKLSKNSENLFLQTNTASSSQILISSQIFSALEQSYGSMSGLGIAQRSGRIFFHQCMKQLPYFSPLRQMDFLLLPPPKKFIEGLQLVSQVCTAWFKEKIETHEAAEEWVWAVSGSTLSQPLWVAWQKGLLYGASTHFSQGKVHLIEEKQNSATLSQAFLSISKRPLAY